MSSELRETLKAISLEVGAYFDEASLVATKTATTLFGSSVYAPTYHYWDQLPEELQKKAMSLVNKILPPCAKLAILTRSSPLTGAEDLQDVKLATKALRSALQLRKFHYSRADVLHDEGSILGVRPAEQSEDRALSPSDARLEFNDKLATIASVLKLIEASPVSEQSAENSIRNPGNKYIAGTAFIMMWMDPKNPELADVLDTVKDVCRKFDIRATRADDIEHEGQITERILNEIKTSEFLFADLTGMRPNVYYEIGFAHALGKRVILFRKSGTNIHFDLAGYNCPDYENLRDLREKLIKRLVSITNKDPREEGTI